jgi:excisionase family DNA binding protein
MTETLLTAADVGKLVKLNPETILRHRRKGLIQGTRLGRSIRFNSDAVKAYLATQQAPAGQ